MGGGGSLEEVVMPPTSVCAIEKKLATTGVSLSLGGAGEVGKLPMSVCN